MAELRRSFVQVILDRSPTTTSPFIPLPLPARGPPICTLTFVHRGDHATTTLSPLRWLAQRHLAASPPADQTQSYQAPFSHHCGTPGRASCSHLASPKPATTTIPPPRSSLLRHRPSRLTHTPATPRSSPQTSSTSAISAGRYAHHRHARRPPSPRLPPQRSSTASSTSPPPPRRPVSCLHARTPSDRHAASHHHQPNPPRMLGRTFIPRTPSPVRDCIVPPAMAPAVCHAPRPHDAATASVATAAPTAESGMPLTPSLAYLVTGGTPSSQLWSSPMQASRRHFLHQNPPNTLPRRASLRLTGVNRLPYPDIDVDAFFRQLPYSAVGQRPRPCRPYPPPFSPVVPPIPPPRCQPPPAMAARPQRHHLKPSAPGCVIAHPPHFQPPSPTAIPRRHCPSGALFPSRPLRHIANQTPLPLMTPPPAFTRHSPCPLVVM